FYVEAAANPNVAGDWTFSPTSLGDKATSGDELRYRIGRISLAELDEQVWELSQDIWTLSGLMHELPTELPRRYEILRALENMLDVL
ncbi:alpha-mannosidase 2C1, partial [Vibrio vulnificus]